jgi:hypothetical protein
MKQNFLIKSSRTIGVLTVSFAVLLVLACQEPVPLHGQWADNMGDSMMFSSDGTFSASITDPGTKIQADYEGTWNILLNSLKLSIPSNNLKMVTEWDIRGNMLYLQWTTVTGPVSMTLYKISI